ncbi:hypothetical protein [Erythrobacter mangrovi]|uniref:Uncharacterized protein n=1 Tax=Erythrobacter mangrovi TaxID=2739433 RepID=A0A7D4B971_9SPHN|nr:hypothetical protein [Erythrobacter mangrovi]QKG72523.1 hypothetical protein HQR01_14735 [Erythrobacter mangrovi]
MDPELPLIFAFVLTLVLTVFVMAHSMHRRTVRHEERKLELEAQIEQAKAQQALKGDADFRKFEDRLRVLERIATDGNHALAAQIEELRSLDAIENRPLTQEKTQ